MMRSSSILPFRSAPRSAHSKKPSTQGVTDFLRAHDRMAALLPAVARLTALQKDCATVLPTLFETCSVMHFDAGQLVLATPNNALAARLKQQLPKLQDSLLKRGWQVSAIKIKVQVGKISEKTTPQKQIALPTQALGALAVLNESLEDSASNAALKAAIGTMLKRHREKK
jgi:hypothetical protein